jgi:ADP-ribose pyrophosphatase
MANGRVVFSTPWFEIEAIDVGITDTGNTDAGNTEVGAGGRDNYYRLNAEDGVMILPLTSDGRVVCIRQFRPAVQEWTLELPSGGVSPGESVETAARRELEEETGYRAGPVIQLNAGRIMANRINAMQYTVLAQNCEPKPGTTPETGISVEVLSIEDLKEMALSGYFSHYTALASLVMARWRGLDIDF